MANEGFGFMAECIVAFAGGKIIGILAMTTVGLQP